MNGSQMAWQRRRHRTVVIEKTGVMFEKMKRWWSDLRGRGSGTPGRRCTRRVGKRERDWRSAVGGGVLEGANVGNRLRTRDGHVVVCREILEEEDLGWMLAVGYIHG